MVSKTPASAMDYIRQIKAFTAFSQLFEFRADAVKVDNAIFRYVSPPFRCLCTHSFSFPTKSSAWLITAYFLFPLALHGFESKPPILFMRFCSITKFGSFPEQLRLIQINRIHRWSISCDGGFLVFPFSTFSAHVSMHFGNHIFEVS